MNAKLTLLGAIFVAVVLPASAHRLDEYLQATLLSVEKSRLKADLFLIPGVAVLPTVLPGLDPNGDGVISETERQTYARRVLADLTLTVDGDRVVLRLISLKFPSFEELKAGTGDIHLELAADLPAKGVQQKLRLENAHFSKIAVYQVNLLTSHEPAIQLGAEHRDPAQSVYELAYTQVTVH